MLGGELGLFGASGEYGVHITGLQRVTLKRTRQAHPIAAANGWRPANRRACVLPVNRSACLRLPPGGGKRPSLPCLKALGPRLR
jgi:hypothetical protein